MKRRRLASIIDVPPIEPVPSSNLHIPIRKLTFEESTIQIKKEPVEKDDKADEDSDDRSTEERPKPSKRSKRVSSDDVVYISESESDNDSDYQGRVKNSFA